MTKFALGAMILSVGFASAAPAEHSFKEIVGTTHGREGLPGFKQKCGLAGATIGGSFHFMTYGSLNGTDVLIIQRVEKKDEKGQVLQYRLTDLMPAPTLAKDHLFASRCTGPKGDLKGVSGIVNFGDRKDSLWKTAVQLFQIDSRGHFREISPIGILCKDYGWGT